MHRPKTKRNKRRPPLKKDTFAAVARRLGCDEDKATFEAKLAKIAKAKPKDKPASQKGR
jgi:hypothetical protein